MKNINLRVLLSAVCVVSILGCFTKGVSAAPIRFDQVVQIVNARPSQAQNTLSTIVVAGGYTNPLLADDDDNKKQQQDGRVITTTTSDIVKDDTCDCVEEEVHHRGFPKWALLGLAAIPIAFIIIHHHHETPTPTGTIPNMTPTPGITPTPPGGGTPTPTPPGMTPTPTPPPSVPEPMTILLFGTGLASIGLAARRRFGKKDENGSDEEE